MKLLTFTTALLVAGSALAQDLPKTELQVIGGLSNLTAYQQFEQPFWTKTIPEKSGGKVTATIKGFNEMGLKGPELLRLMSQGVVPFGTATLSYFASDNPINEAIDLPGLAPDVETARKVTEAFQPVYEKFYGEGQAAWHLHLSGAGNLLQCRHQEPRRPKGQKGPHLEPHPGRICRSIWRHERHHGLR
mgnify:CR=1 FL=1